MDYSAYLDKLYSIQDDIENKLESDHDMVSRRNEILSSHFMSKDIDRAIAVMAYRNTYLKEAGWVKDAKQECFLKFLKMPPETIIKYENCGRLKPFLVHVILQTASMREGWFFKKMFRNNLKTDEWIPWKHEDVFDEGQASDKNDIIIHCVQELEKLSYPEREAILLYARTGVVAKAVKSSGQTSRTYHKYLQAARKRLWTNLYHKGVIDRMPYQNWSDDDFDFSVIEPFIESFDSLPGRDEAILSMYYRHGLSVKEISIKMGCDYKTMEKSIRGICVGLRQRRLHGNIKLEERSSREGNAGSENEMWDVFRMKYKAKMEFSEIAESIGLDEKRVKRICLDARRRINVLAQICRPLVDLSN